MVLEADDIIGWNHLGREFCLDHCYKYCTAHEGTNQLSEPIYRADIIDTAHCSIAKCRKQLN